MLPRFNIWISLPTTFMNNKAIKDGIGISHLITLTFVVWCLASTASAQRDLTLELVTEANAPLFVTHAPGDQDRLFIVERGGEIRIFNLSSRRMNKVSFLDIDEPFSGSEGGLLGLAFHPDYQRNGFFYVYFSSADNINVKRFAAENSDIANPDSGQDVLMYPHLQPIHLGGWIGFGKDGYLHIATGDGSGNAQDTSNFGGSILRIDVNGDDFPDDKSRNYSVPLDNPFVGMEGNDEIFLYGLRNPWRCSFDRETGDLWIGDPGGFHEEINLFLDGSANRNHGWPFLSGVVEDDSGLPQDNVFPVFSYFGGTVIGGYVYHGTIPELKGAYVFGTLGGGILSHRYDGTLPFDGGNYVGRTRWGLEFGLFGQLVSFGEDAAGELYTCQLSGAIHKIVSAEVTSTVQVDELETIAGVEVAGGLSSLEESDDQYFVVHSETVDGNLPPISIDVIGASRLVEPGSLSFLIESNASTPNIRQSILLFNIQTSQYDLIDQRTVSWMEDSNAIVEAPDDHTQYIRSFFSQNAYMQAQVEYEPVGFVIHFPWSISVDTLHWQVFE